MPTIGLIDGPIAVYGLPGVSNKQYVIDYLVRDGFESALESIRRKNDINMLGIIGFTSLPGNRDVAKILSSAVVGVEPRIMGIGPVQASNKALEKAGLTMEDMDVIELNEAFAAQALACIREWGLKDDDPKLNPNGGAIAIGHPLGVTGARLAHSAALELQLTGKKYALVTMCVGVGQGYAAVIENVSA